MAAAVAGSRCRSPCRSCGRCATRTDGPSLNGALARTGQLQLVFCVLLSAGICWRADGGSSRWSVARLRAARAAARRLGRRSPSASCCAVRLDAERRARRARRGGAARALRRRAARARSGPRSTPTRRCSRPRRARPRPSCSRPAGPSATCPRRWPRSTSRCGTCAGKRAGRPVAELISVEAGALGPGQRDDRRRGPRRRRGRGGGRRAGRLRLREGQGRDRRRRGAASPRCAPRSGRDVAIRVDANGAWDGRRGGRARCARSRRPGSSCRGAGPRRRGAARGARPRSPCRSRWTRPPPSEGAAGSGAADAVCLKIARCGGISGVLRDAARGAGGAARTSTSPRPTTARSGSRPPSTPRPA